MQIKITDRILVSLQRMLPARLMSKLVYKLARIEAPWFKNSFIRIFCWLYNVDTTEAEKPIPEAYVSFNEFFTRKLRDGARPVTDQPDGLACPADGTVAEFGRAENGILLQAKGVNYSAADLLTDNALATELANQSFITIYLAPYNYHRLHMPADGRLEKTHFVPGLLYSVNARTTANVPGLYALNERLVCQFSSNHGRFAMILVGAMNVASISTQWDGEIMPPADGKIVTKVYSQADQPELKRGDYMGHFNMGSTVVLLGPHGALNWAQDILPGATVQVGQTLATPNA